MKKESKSGENVIEQFFGQIFAKMRLAIVTQIEFKKGLHMWMYTGCDSYHMDVHQMILTLHF